MRISVSGWDIKYRNGSILKKFAEGKGLPGRKPFPLPQQLGREAVGLVVQVGKNVTQFQSGDRVLGLVHPEKSGDINAIHGFGNLSVGLDYPGHAMKGGNAQYVSRPEHYWMPIPDNVPYGSGGLLVLPNQPSYYCGSLLSQNGRYCFCDRGFGWHGRRDFAMGEIGRSNRDHDQPPIK